MQTLKRYQESPHPRKGVFHPYSLKNKLENSFFSTTGTKMYKFITFNSGASYSNTMLVSAVVYVTSNASNPIKSLAGPKWFQVPLFSLAGMNPCKWPLTQKISSDTISEKCSKHVTYSRVVGNTELEAEVMSEGRISLELKLPGGVVMWCNFPK